MSEYFRRMAAAAVFGADKPGKADLFAGRHLFVGINCFEPGQTQRVHTHAGADKFYLVVSGRARMTSAKTRRPGRGRWCGRRPTCRGVAEARRTVLLVGSLHPPGWRSAGQPWIRAASCCRARRSVGVNRQTSSSHLPLRIWRPAEN
jgi:hypothetical protein